MKTNQTKTKENNDKREIQLNENKTMTNAKFNIILRKKININKCEIQYNIKKSNCEIHQNKNKTMTNVRFNESKTRQK